VQPVPLLPVGGVSFFFGGLRVLRDESRYSRPPLWARIRSVWERDEFGLPSFWSLQALGWAGFFVLILLTVVLPAHSKQEFWNQTTCWGAVFVVSCLLRPVCRGLLKKSLPWIDLELWAFGLCALGGAVAAFASEVLKSGVIRFGWADFLEGWLQSSVLLFLWCTLYFSIKQWQQSVRERQRLVRAESEAREARLSALRYQLNPHFLFNSLNAASTLVLQGKTSAATRMLAQIGELLRTALDNDAPAEVPFAQELAFVEQYLAIEQTRLGDRLRIHTAIARETLDAAVPSMLLQPLVENAVRHGVAALIEGGIIAIESIRQGDRLLMTIRNSGPSGNECSFETSVLSKGIGLANTAERLKALYGNDLRFSFRSREAGGYEVAIEIPFRKVARNVEEGVCAH
jgi:two-component system, LytTR family, sensor kinase